MNRMGKGGDYSVVMNVIIFQDNCNVVFNDVKRQNCISVSVLLSLFLYLSHSKQCSGIVTDMSGHHGRSSLK